MRDSHFVPTVNPAKQHYVLAAGHPDPKQAYLVDPLITSPTGERKMWCEVIVVNYIEVGDPDAIATTS